MPNSAIAKPMAVTQHHLVKKKGGGGKKPMSVQYSPSQLFSKVFFNPEIGSVDAKPMNTQV